MLEVIICTINISCALGEINDILTLNKYPPDVAELCESLNKDGKKLPYYCELPKEKIPRRRNEF